MPRPDLSSTSVQPDTSEHMRDVSAQRETEDPARVKQKLSEAAAQSDQGGTGPVAQRRKRGISARLQTRWRLFTRLPVLLMVTCTLLLIGSVQAMWHIGSGVSRSLEWQAEADRLNAENAQLNEDIKVLEEAKAALKTPEYLGEMARCLGFVGVDETVLVADGAPAGGAGCDTRRLP